MGLHPFPGSDNADDNKYLFGKYDQGWVIAANTANKDASLKYLTEFSDPANYQAFANAVGFIPTQPGAKLETQIGQEVAPYLANFRVGYEQYWVGLRAPASMPTRTLRTSSRSANTTIRRNWRTRCRPTCNPGWTRTSRPAAATDNR